MQEQVFLAEGWMHMELTWWLVPSSVPTSEHSPVPFPEGHKKRMLAPSIPGLTDGLAARRKSVLRDLRSYYSYS